MTLHWEDATRSQARVAAYDPAVDFPGGLDAYLDALASARVLIMLTGPAGMGKSFWCQNLADRLGLEYGSIPMTEGATPSWILGAQRLNGFGENRFLQIWRDGGVFLLDEMDAADPNMLLVVNDALANGVLHNPVNGESYTRHPDCILIAATNTLGTGADASYTGRNQLDFSTLDRWRMGRAFVGYSRRGRRRGDVRLAGSERPGGPGGFDSPSAHLKTNERRTAWTLTHTVGYADVAAMWTALADGGLGGLGARQRLAAAQIQSLPDSFSGCTTAEMRDWVANGYVAPGMDVKPVRNARPRRKLRFAEEGELQVDMALSGHDTPFLDWGKRTRTAGAQAEGGAGRPGEHAAAGSEGLRRVADRARRGASGQGRRP
jgi:hypothetical protein